MSITTPTTKEISDNIIAQLEASLNQTLSLLPKSFNRVLAKALAAVWVTLYKYGGFIFLQMFPATASFKETLVNGISVTPLIELGRQIGAGDPSPASQAQLNINISVNTAGGSLPAGTQLFSSTNGVTYAMTTTTVLIAPSTSAVVMAVGDQSGGSGAGEIGNLEDGATMSFTETQLDVEQEAVVGNTVIAGTSEQSEASYRNQVLTFWQAPPQGGAYSDYRIWATGVPGIVNAYPYTSAQPGQVDVYSEATPASSGNPDGIPNASQLQAVLDSINFDISGLASRRPASSFVNSLAISRVAFNVKIFNLTVDNLTQVQSDIDQGLTDYYLSREPYIAGLSAPPRKDRVTQSAASGVVEDIVTAAGGTFDSVAVDIAGLPTVAYSLQEGEKAKLDAVTYP